MNARRDWLAWAALLAALGVTASAEWQLAVAVGFGPYVAAGVPAALDIYAVRALRARKDVAAVVGAMIVVQALAHLVASRLLAVSVPLVVAVSTIAPLVLWRVHRIGHEDPTPDPGGAAVAVERDADRDTAPAVAVSQVSPASRPELAPAVAEPLVICGGHLPIPAVPPRPRLDTEAAREAIERAWRDGLSIREAARVSTRSPAQVQRVYARLDADHGPQPIAGQLAIA